MRIIPLLITLLLFSCVGQAGGTDGEGGTESGDSSSIAEQELNEDRVDAVSYNNRLNSILEGSLDNIDLLFSSDSADIEANLDNVLFDLDLNYTAVNETQGFEEDDSFKSALLEFLAFYINELQGAFSSDIKPIIRSGSSSAKDVEILENYDKQFSEKENDLFQKVLTAQSEFASNNNIKLSE